MDEARLIACISLQPNSTTRLETRTAALADRQIVSGDAEDRSAVLTAASQNCAHTAPPPSADAGAATSHQSDSSVACSASAGSSGSMCASLLRASRSHRTCRFTACGVFVRSRHHANCPTSKSRGSRINCPRSVCNGSLKYRRQCDMMRRAVPLRVATEQPLERSRFFGVLIEIHRTRIEVLSEPRADLPDHRSSHSPNTATYSRSNHSVEHNSATHPPGSRLRQGVAIEAAQQANNPTELLEI